MNVLFFINTIFLLYFSVAWGKGSLPDIIAKVLFTILTIANGLCFLKTIGYVILKVHG